MKCLFIASAAGVRGSGAFGFGAPAPTLAFSSAARSVLERSVLGAASPPPVPLATGFPPARRDRTAIRTRSRADRRELHVLLDEQNLHL